MVWAAGLVFPVGDGAGEVVAVLVGAADPIAVGVVLHIAQGAFAIAAVGGSHRSCPNTVVVGEVIASVEVGR